MLFEKYGNILNSLRRLALTLSSVATLGLMSHCKIMGKSSETKAEVVTPSSESDQYAYILGVVLAKYTALSDGEPACVVLVSHFDEDAVGDKHSHTDKALLIWSPDPSRCDEVVVADQNHDKTSHYFRPIRIMQLDDKLRFQDENYAYEIKEFYEWRQY